MRKGQGRDCTLSLALPLVTYEPFSAMFDTRQKECLKSQSHEVSAGRPPAHGSVFAVVWFSPCPAPTGGDMVFQVGGGMQRCFATRLGCRDMQEGRQD